MGTLKPGATYIYERVDDTVYAREFGSDPATRTVVGYSLSDRDREYYKNIADGYFLQATWAPILREAEHNSSLREAIERVKILYHLSKNNGQE